MWFFGGGASRCVIKALIKLRINLWPDLCYVTSEPKLLRIHAYFFYKNSPFRLDRLITGKVVRGSGKLDGSFAETPSLLF